MIFVAAALKLDVAKIKCYFRLIEQLLGNWHYLKCIVVLSTLHRVFALMTVLPSLLAYLLRKFVRIAAMTLDLKNKCFESLLPV